MARRDVFQAIADPVRRDIISLLAHESLTVNAVTKNLKQGISRPAVSRHLIILQKCGIVVVQQKGRERFCSIQPKSLKPVAEWVEQHRALWEEKLDSFESYLTELQAKNIKDE